MAMMDSTCESGYDFEVITKPHPDMHCMVCEKLMREPVQFKCTHGTCKPCYQNICVAACKKSLLAQCPSCKKVIDDRLVNSNDMLHRMILTVRVKCSNACYGCYWIGKIGDIKDHYEDCRHLISTYRRSWRNRLKDEALQRKGKMTACPYFPYGCIAKEFNEKDLKKHLLNNAKYHLIICTDFIRKNHGKPVQSHQSYMETTLDNIFTTMEKISTMVSKLEETHSNMDVVRNVLTEHLMPFHELYEHVKEPEKYIPRVEVFVESVTEYVKKFDKKAFLELSMPCVADDTASLDDVHCRKISVSDMFRFDKERLNDNYDKIAKKLRSLKKVHYTCFVLAKDVVKKVEKRDGCDLDLLFTQETMEKLEDEEGVEERESEREEVQERTEDEIEDGILGMQKCFENKVDSILKTLDDAVDSISTSYRAALLNFINDKYKGHNYTDYYIWQVDASKFKNSGRTSEYTKPKGQRKISGDCFSVWSTVDDVKMEGDFSFKEGLIIAKYFVKTKKSYINARVFCFNQMEVDRVAPCQLTISKVLEGDMTTFSVTAEFPIDKLKNGCVVNDTMFFNTVIT